MKRCGGGGTDLGRSMLGVHFVEATEGRARGKPVFPMFPHSFCPKYRDSEGGESPFSSVCQTPEGCRNYRWSAENLGDFSNVPVLFHAWHKYRK